MANEQRDYIKRIRDESQASQRIKDSLNYSIEALAKDLYSKDTHFIFELIQNAEDNTYRKLEPSLSFRLTKIDPTDTQATDGALIIQNNEIGFSPDNVDAICAVGKTTKSKIQGYIGEKGIGFKSVFRVTTTPYIFSNGYHFCLPEHDEDTGLGYIVPRCIEKPPEGIDPSQTTIILPLDKTGFGYERIEKMLRDIEPETILFLSKLKEIHMKTDTGDALTILKDDSKMPLVQILVEGEKQSESFSNVDEFLFYTQTFDKPEDINQEKREDIDEREVSIAFPLNKDEESTGKIFAYLPVRSDTGLPFLINADFILPSSREDIKDVPWNHWLMECVAELIPKALVGLKEQGLLTVTFFETLVSRMNEIDEDSIFYPVVEAVHSAFVDEELLPADDDTFVCASSAKIGSSADLRTLLNQDQLYLFFKATSNIKWLSGDISERLTPNLHSYLRQELSIEEITPDAFGRKISQPFLVNQTDDWFVEFYKYLLGQEALWRSPRSTEDHGGFLRKRPILRLQGDILVSPFDDDKNPCAYLPPEDDTDLPVIKRAIVDNEEVLGFLKKLGITEIDMVAEVLEEVLPKYRIDSTAVSTEEHWRDIEKIVRAYSIDSQEKKKRLKVQLDATPFILTEKMITGKPEYRRPNKTYFMTNELMTYFAGNDTVGFVSSKYNQSMLVIFKEVGVSDSIRIICKSRLGWTEDVSLSYEDNYRRGLRGYDPGIDVDGLKNALMNMSVKKSNIIWNKIALPYGQCIKGRILYSSRKDFSPNASTHREKENISNFGHLLLESTWLPTSDGGFVNPSELGLDDLPESFSRDERLAEQLGMKKDVVAKLAAEAGIPVEDIDWLKQHPEEFKKWKATFVPEKKPEFPKRTSPNPERRQERLEEQLNDAPEKEYEKRNRSVRTTRGDIDPTSWLRSQYINETDQIVCQICTEEMPFKKLDGEYYFEAVEVLIKDYLPKEHEAQFLALCPVCAARYKEFVKRDESAMNSFIDAVIESDEPVIDIQLGDRPARVRFIETHFDDLKVVFEKMKAR